MNRNRALARTSIGHRLQFDAGRRQQRPAGAPRAIRIAYALCSTLLACGCENLQERAGDLLFGGRYVEARMVPANGSVASGVAKFTSTSGGVAVTMQLSGLLTGTTYRIVIHANGNCSSPNAFSAGPPWIPSGAKERSPIETSAAVGYGTFTFVTRIAGLHLDGPDSIVGRSIVVHAGTQSSLEARPDVPNDRVACGVIGAGPFKT